MAGRGRARRRRTGAAGEPRPGLLLIDKPAGPTSHDVVGFVRWALRCTAVGHCGTLDPAATGLLVVCVGAATKLAALLSGADKTYRATFVLGAATTTADAEGEIVAQAPCDAAIAERAGDVLRAMRGELSLPPPAFSAVHVPGGGRAHERARAGEVVDLAPRPMTVHEVEGVAARAAADGRVEVDATLRVSKGAYIRSIAVELGARVGVPAHLGSLRRLAAGRHRLDDPRVVSSLHARRLAAPPGAPAAGPRFRIRPAPEAIEAQGGTAHAPAHAPAHQSAPAVLAAPAPQPERAEVGRWLSRHRLLPWTGLGVPVARIGHRAPETAELVSRLRHGQALGRATLALGSALPACGVAALLHDPPAGSPTLILADVDAEAVRPRRVVLSPGAP